MLLASFALVALLPMFLGAIAALAAFILARRIVRQAESDYVPESTPEETAEWIASFETFDIDAEWIALADAPMPVTRDFRVSMVAACERAKERTETRKRESRAAIAVAIMTWQGREDQMGEGKADPMATLDYLDNRAVYVALHFAPLAMAA